MIFGFRRGGHGQEQAYGGADHRCAEAVEAGRTVEVWPGSAASVRTIYAWKAKHTTLNRSRHAQATIFVLLGCEPVLGMRTRFFGGHLRLHR